MMIEHKLRITQTIFSTFRLTYQSPLLKHLKIDNVEFSTAEQLYTYLQTWINNELLQAIEGYLLWRTNRFQYMPASEDRLRAIEVLKTAREVLKDMELSQRPQVILDTFIPPMIVMAPREEQRTYEIAINKVEALENYCYDLIEQQNILLCSQDSLQAPYTEGLNLI